MTQDQWKLLENIAAVLVREAAESCSEAGLTFVTRTKAGEPGEVIVTFPERVARGMLRETPA
ncbi:MAG TPA: hypothetical protein VLH09_02770 [Bryobacteraceae bacterium]|nr:hypothetical protein [Bryobacteraceae bacterium]